MSTYNGKTYEVNGKETFFISGDYPYYRDQRQNWEKKLEQVALLGIDTITCYVPWRHHLVVLENGMHTYSFTSEYRENADLIYFMDLMIKNNLKCILKPGPFVHAELINGGIPDYVLPENNQKVDFMLDGKGQKNSYMGAVLPNPFSSEYYTEAMKWYDSLDREIISKYKDSIITGIQISNEGIYSDASSSIDLYDYSETGKKLFLNFLKNEYQDVEQYNIKHGTCYEDFADINIQRDEYQEPGIVACEDWCKWIETYILQFYRHYSQKWRDQNIPVLINLNSPQNGNLLNNNYDTWLAKNYLSWDDEFILGYTNWLGNPSKEKSKFEKMVFMSKIYRWPNIEDNWGHSWAGEEYMSADVSLLCASIMLAGGVTGFNVYNICSTDVKQKHLTFSEDRIEKYADLKEVFRGVYCEGAVVGNPNQGKAEKLKAFVQFVNRNKEMLECKKDNRIHFGINMPYVYITAKGQSEKNHILSYEESIMKVANLCLDYNMEFDYFNLEDMSNEYQKGDYIVMPCYKSLPLSAQKKLVAQVEKGIHIILIGNVPIEDENHETCRIFTDSIEKYNEQVTRISFESFNDDICYEIVETMMKEIPYIKKDGLYITSLRKNNTEFKFVINRDEKEHPIDTIAGEKFSDVVLKQYGFMIIKFENGVLVDHYINSLR